MPWYYGWNVLAAGIVFQAISFGVAIYCFTFWVAPWSEEFSAGRGEVMVVFMTLQVGMGLLSPFVGRAMDHRSIRLLVICGAFCLALAFALAARATALWQLMFIYGSLVVAGTLLAGPLPAQTLAAKWFTRRRGLALGISTVGTSIGGFLMPPLVTALQARYGWRDANDLLALLIVVAIVPLAWLIVRNSPEDAGRQGEAPAEAVQPAGNDAAQAAAEQAATEASWTTGQVLRQRAFWLTVLAFVPMTTAFGAAQQNLAPFAADQSVDAQATSYLVSLMQLTMIAAKIFFGAMADRWDVRWLFMMALSVLGVAFSLMLGNISYAQLVVVSMFLGVAAGGFLPLLAAIISRTFGVAAFGSVMGLLGPFTTLAALGPWVAGYLRDSTGSYDAAWLAMGALLIPSALAMLLNHIRR